MTDLADFLRARYVERRALAEAAAHNGAGRWTQIDPERKHGWIEDEAGDTVVFDEGSPTGEQAQHIAAHDPAYVIADLDAKQALLADLQSERHEVVDGDCWYTCAAATEERDGGETCDDGRRGSPCDCGRDARVERRLRILARPFAGHPEHKEEWCK